MFNSQTISSTTFREWGSDASDYEDENHRSRAEREEQKEKNRRHKLIINEFKKRRGDVSGAKMYLLDD